MVYEITKGLIYKDFKDKCEYKTEETRKWETEGEYHSGYWFGGGSGTETIEICNFKKAKEGCYVSCNSDCPRIFLDKNKNWSINNKEQAWLKNKIKEEKLKKEEVFLSERYGRRIKFKLNGVGFLFRTDDTGSPTYRHVTCIQDKNAYCGIPCDFGKYHNKGKTTIKISCTLHPIIIKLCGNRQG
jgi:hypothetical protein